MYSNTVCPELVALLVTEMMLKTRDRPITIEVLAPLGVRMAKSRCRFLSSRNLGLVLLLLVSSYKVNGLYFSLFFTLIESLREKQWPGVHLHDFIPTLICVISSDQARPAYVSIFWPSVNMVFYYTVRQKTTLNSWP